MSATEREIRLRIVATDTHCGDGHSNCRRLRPGEERWQCQAHGREIEYGDIREWPQRLPECIAAEGAGQKGGTC